MAQAIPFFVCTLNCIHLNAIPVLANSSKLFYSFGSFYKKNFVLPVTFSKIGYYKGEQLKRTKS